MNNTWPEGVIARYATVGGATVDIRTETAEIGWCTGERRCQSWIALDGHPGAEITISANCTGTGCTDPTGPTETIESCTQRIRKDTAEPGIPLKLRDWAQSHAESCRAMPKS